MYDQDKLKQAMLGVDKLGTRIPFRPNQRIVLCGP